MFPFLHLFKIQIPMYGFCILMGIIIAALLSFYLCKLQKKDFLNLILIGAIVIGLGFAGAKILFILVTFPPKYFFKIIYALLFTNNGKILASGFVFYGGLIFGIPAYFLAVKIAGCKKTEYVDMFAFIIPLVHGFGRIGCFCAGCCYGIPYEGPFAVHYSHPLSSVPTGIGIFPVQLVEAMCLLILAFVIFILIKKNKTGLFFVYLLAYSVIRFVLEFFRYDSERGGFSLLSTSQFISLIMFLAGILGLLCTTLLKKKINK